MEGALEQATDFKFAEAQHPLPSVRLYPQNLLGGPWISGASQQTRLSKGEILVVSISATTQLRHPRSRNTHMGYCM